MKTRAAVAWEPGKPLAIEEIEVEGPRQGEVLLKVVASGVCHTDWDTMNRTDHIVLGHEGRHSESESAALREAHDGDLAGGDAGLEQVDWHGFMGGIVALHVGTVPGADEQA